MNQSQLNRITADAIRFGTTRKEVVVLSSMLVILINRLTSGHLFKAVFVAVA